VSHRCRGGKGAIIFGHGSSSDPGAFSYCICGYYYCIRFYTYYKKHIMYFC
jgi:hypothetical protein